MSTAGGGEAAQARAAVLMEVLEEFFARACDEDERLARRLTVADTVWSSTLTDAGESFTIYFDRFPIEFRREGDPAAEVKTFATVDETVDTWLGQTFIGLSIAEGTTTYEGPVRKVLRVVPMFRPLAKYGRFRDLFRPR